MSEQAGPEHFVGERVGARNQHERENPERSEKPATRARKRARGGGRRIRFRHPGGVGCLLKRYQRAGNPGCDQKHQEVDEYPHPDRPRQSQHGQQEESRRDGAADRTDRVQCVEPSYPGSDLILGTDHVPGEHGQRCPHASGGDRKHDEGHHQVEHGLAKAAGIGRLRLSAQNSAVKQVCQRQQQRYGQGGQCDAGFQNAVNENGTRDSIDVAAGDAGAQRQPRHVSGKNGRHGKLRSAEHHRELSHPCRLVEQGGKAREHETRADSDQRGECRRLGGGCVGPSSGGGRGGGRDRFGPGPLASLSAHGSRSRRRPVPPGFCLALPHDRPAGTRVSIRPGSGTTQTPIIESIRHRMSAWPFLRASIAFSARVQVS